MLHEIFRYQQYVAALAGKDRKMSYFTKNIQKTYIVVAKVTLVSVVRVKVLPSMLHFTMHPAAFVL